MIPTPSQPPSLLHQCIPARAAKPGHRRRPVLAIARQHKTTLRRTMIQPEIMPQLVLRNDVQQILALQQKITDHASLGACDITPAKYAVILDL